MPAAEAGDIGIEATVALEPARRDSAPALIAAALIAQRLFGEGCLVLALAADHVVRDEQLFLDACRTAALAAADDRIVTFGHHPDRAAYRLWLYPPRHRAGAGRRPHRRRLRREARQRDSGALSQRGLPLGTPATSCFRHAC